MLNRPILLCLAGVLSAAAALGQEPKRGYSIPLLDLASQTDRQVVVDREKGQYLGHPTTLLLEDGKTILIVYPKGHGKGPIQYKKSTDAGLTWSDRLPTPENWATSQETPTIHRTVDADGKKRLILFSGLYPIRRAVSEDDGQTWSPLEKIGDYGGIVAMGSVDRLKDGSYMALFHDDGRFIDGKGKAGKFKVYKTISKDAGLTWSGPEVIAEHPKAHLCEPGLVRSPDGKQIAVLLRENSRKLNSFFILSNDEGKTWTEPKELLGSLTGDRHTAKYAPDGRLFISFRDTTLSSPTKGDWVAWVGTYDDIVSGREGQYRVRLMKNNKSADCAYPGVEILADGTFVTTTYGHWTKDESPYIVSVRLKLSELDELAAKNAKEKVSFDPTSMYETRDIRGFTILINQDLLAEHRELAAKTLALLDFQLYQTLRVVPEKVHDQLKQIKIWVELNEGHHPCMAYHPGAGWLRDHGMNPEKAKSVEIANAANFLSWTKQQPWMVLHELAHGYHDRFLDKGYQNEDLKATFAKAKETKQYESVLHINGSDRKAYALTNPMEYFAEGSEAFFGTNDFYPFVQSELKRHDAELYELMKKLWRVD